VKQPYDLAADGSADESVRTILRRLFDELLSNVDGVVDNTNVEFLHDLRVANRRTRSALSQIKGVLPTAVLETYQPEFKWLGDVTGPCRDLDVVLCAIEDHQQRSRTHDGALRPLKNYLGEKRRLEHGLVRDALRSDRFRLLVGGWSQFLETLRETEAAPPHAFSRIIDVAGPQILKSYRRIRKRGSEIDVDLPAAHLHRLRIEGKKLRYLLEFFIALYPRTIVLRFIRDLKQLQDILGDFNDTEVQLAIIREFQDDASSSAETLAATEQLVESITDRQGELRAEFSERFALLASEESRKLYKKTFKTR
jgi:CHAD domain-containing protein